MTSLSKLIGLSLQEMAYKKLGEEKLSSEIEKISRNIRAEQQQVGKAQFQVIMSRKRTHDWMQKLTDVGEVEANRYLIRESIKRSEDPNFDPCEFDW